MADSSGKGRVSIEALAVRVPGRNAAEGRRIAQQVTAALAEQLPAELSGHVEHLKLRVSARSADDPRLTQNMVDSIIRAVGRQQLLPRK